MFNLVSDEEKQLLLDTSFMQQALRQAELAFDAGEVPIGCVIVKDAKVIAKGYNQIEMLKDATAHAEILAIGSASSAVENWRLNDCTMYVTLEPCPMCAGAILNSRISRLVYGSKDTRFGGCGGTIDVLSNNALNREIIVESGVLADECLGLIRLFFQKMRMKKDSLDEKNS
jgi:tRNA(adenine34) deaminase